jgi:subtilisin family serine protease
MEKLKAVLVLAWCVSAGVALGAAPQRSLLRSAAPVAGQYIVVLKEEAVTAEELPARAQELSYRHGATLEHTYTHALRGFSLLATESQALALAEEPAVAYVVEDGQVESYATQTGAPWGLDRVDQRGASLDGNYVYDATGSGVHAYIIDSGIQSTHADFGGRATGDYTAINDGNGANDCNGHGTHVAGLVGSATWGVAKGVRLHGVRVLNCSGTGTASQLIAGIDWVTANHVKPAVALVSSGLAANTAVDDAVRRSINAGVTYVAAAGNNNQDACGYSPARVSEVLTVGATDSYDSRVYFSNYGGCVDLFAPGWSITSTYTSAGGSAPLNGTSMAAAQVAGTVALSLQQSAACPSDVSKAILSAATANVVGGASGSKNRLVHTRLTAANTAAYFDFGGMYGYSSSGPVNNPYTGSHSCPAGYTGYTVLGTPNLDHSVVFCARYAQGDTEPVADFGGMYGYYSNSYGEQTYVNPLTGSDSCPAGYSATTLLDTAHLDYPLVFCHRPHSQTVRGRYRLGGMYGAYWTGSAHAAYTNPLTGGSSCKPGYSAATALGTINIDYPVSYCYLDLGP